MTAHNLDVIAAILISLAVVVPLAVFFDRRRSSRRVVDLNVEREARRPAVPSNVTRIGWEGNVRQLPRGRGWSA